VDLNSDIGGTFVKNVLWPGTEKSCNHCNNWNKKKKKVILLRSVKLSRQPELVFHKGTLQMPLMWMANCLAAPCGRFPLCHPFWVQELERVVVVAQVWCYSTHLLNCTCVSLVGVYIYACDASTCSSLSSWLCSLCWFCRLDDIVSSSLILRHHYVGIELRTHESHFHLNVVFISIYLSIYLTAIFNKCSYLIKFYFILIE
jgi:hypothetical protein